MTKSQAYYNSIKQDRYEWADERPQRCMRCLKEFRGFRWREIHEIERRSQAPNNWWHRCNGLLLCNPCHTDFDNATEWPHARQLALKRRMDREHFNLSEWHNIGRRPLSYVTFYELDDWDSRDAN